MSDLATVQDSNAGTAVPGEVAPQVETQAQPSAQPQDSESRARAMGWVPKEEFRGPAENWRDADEFVRRGEEVLPIVQERNRDLTRRLSDLEAKLAETQNSYQTNIKRLETMSVVALDRQRKQLAANYDAAMRQAAESADVTRYDQLQQDKAASLRHFDDSLAETVKRHVQEQPNSPPREVQEFVTRNQWFATDPAMNHAAQAFHLHVQQEHPGMSLSENLAEVERRVRQMFPQKFGPVRHAASAPQYGAVEGGSAPRLASSAGRSKGVNELPADARKQGERFVAQGLFKDLAEYAKEYHAES